MTARKEEEKEDGILERMLRSLGAIGQNVERAIDRMDFHNSGTRQRYDDEWRPEDLYEGEEY